MSIRLFLCVISVFLWSGLSLADTLTAICGPLQGYTLGIAGANEGHKQFSERDGMSGQTTVVWEIGASAAQIVSRGQAGGTPLLESGVVTLSTKDQISFVVVYPVSVFLYSIFPERRRLLLTKHTHTRGAEFDAARMLAFHGACSINIK
jgi:hypothetical protein